MPINRPTDSTNQTTPASGQTTASNTHTVQEISVQLGVEFVDVAELRRTCEKLKAAADSACLNLGRAQIENQRLEQEAKRTGEMCASLERQLGQTRCEAETRERQHARQLTEVGTHRELVQQIWERVRRYLPGNEEVVGMMPMTALDHLERQLSAERAQREKLQSKLSWRLSQLIQIRDVAHSADPLLAKLSDGIPDGLAGTVRRMRDDLDAVHQVVAEQSGPNKIADGELAQVVRGWAVIWNDLARTLNEYSEALQPVRRWVDNGDRLATLKRLVKFADEHGNGLATCETSALRADLIQAIGARNALRAQLDKIFAAIGFKPENVS